MCITFEGRGGSEKMYVLYTFDSFCPYTCILCMIQILYISMTPLFIELRLSNLCIDIATGQIKAHQPGSVLPLLCQYINYTASVGSNHCLQAIWTSRNCNQ